MNTMDFKEQLKNDLVKAVRGAFQAFSRTASAFIT